MALTLVAYYENIDPAGVDVNIAGVVDQHVFVDGDNITVPELNQIVWMAAGLCNGGDVTARLVAPILRSVVTPYIMPVNGNADADAEPEAIHRIMNLLQSPIKLRTNEQLQAIINTNPTAAQDQWVLVALADGPITPVKGEIFTTRWDSATALVADAWTNVPLDPVEALPNGRYQVVGMRVESAGCIAGRLVFRGYSWRPGVMGCDEEDDLESPLFRFGNCGVFGEFTNLNPPSCDILSLSADAAQVVYLDLMKVG